MVDSELRPCPFCDHSAAKVKLVSQNYAVACEACGVTGPIMLSEEAAVGLWNVRNNTDELIKLLVSLAVVYGDPDYEEVSAPEDIKPVDPESQFEWLEDEDADRATQPVRGHAARQTLDTMISFIAEADRVVWLEDYDDIPGADIEPPPEPATTQLN